MASISVTYTFSNSTTADATQVNQNFQDIIDGLSNGTKDLSISALTVAGNASFQGNVTLGNASGDDITFTGSLASSIPIKTHNSYDIGSVTTLGLRAIYFASSSASKTAKLQGPAVASDVTLTLPSYTGTIANIPSVISSQTTTYAILASDEFIPVSGASGAFTATLPTAVGATGKIYKIKRTDQTAANAVTLATTSSQTIDGATTTTLNTQYEMLEVISDGSNWHILRRHIPSVWTSYTPTLSWTANTTAAGMWRRVGDSMEVQVLASVTGTPTSAVLTATIPSGYTVDTAKMASSTQFEQVLGNVAILDAGTKNYVGAVIYNNTTTVTLISADSGSDAAIDQADPITFANGDRVTANFRVPISGWKG